MPEDAGTQLRLTGSASGKSAAPADPRSTSAAEGSGTWEAAPVAGEAGKVIVVWGPPGAPGRTTLAVTLAAELTRLAGRALLVDADTEAPAVTQVLGILDDASAVAAVSRQAMAGRLDPTSLLRSCPLVDGGLHVMTGLTRADRWREVPAAALEVVWEVARSAVPWTVVDTGATLEAEVGALAGPGRHEATASALAAADVLLVVGAGDPVGMRRLVMALHDLSDAGLAGAEPLVVVNRIRSSAGGATPERSIQEALARFAGVGEAVLVPDDRPMFDKALLQGRSLTEVAPASAARLEIELLARRLTGERRRRRRQRRLFRLRA